MARIRPNTLFLVIVNVGLLALLIVVWRSGQAQVHAPEKITVHRLELPDLSALNAAALPPPDFAAIRDDAVFHSRRSFYRPPAPSEVIPTPEYELAGSMSLPQGKHVAFVKKKSDHSNRTLHIGDDLDGWRVDEIESTRVLLVRDDQHYELTSAVAAAATGLLRAGASPAVIASGPRVLGSSGARTYPLPHVETTARTYRPPPQ